MVFIQICQYTTKEKTQTHPNHKPTPQPTPHIDQPHHWGLPTHALVSFLLTYSPIPIITYNPPYQWDTIFNSQGRALSSQWNGAWYTHPTNYQTITQSKHWAASQENPPNRTDMVSKHIDWTPQKLTLDNQPNIHTITTIPPNMLLYLHVMQWPPYYNHPKLLSQQSTAYIAKMPHPHPPHVCYTITTNHPQNV